MPDIKEHIQALNLGEDITLYSIDLSEYGLNDIRLYHGDEGATAVSFAGISYSPWPIRTTGWRLGSSGSLPRPRFSVANPNRIFTPLIQQADGFRYAPFKRIKTYDNFLDFLPDGSPNPDADGSQHDPIDNYEINRVAVQGEVDGLEVVEWELRAPIDRPNAKIPKVILTRENCQFSYRTYDPNLPGNFNYESVQCPYRGAQSFDANNEPTSDENDVCPRFLRSCRARFGENAELPFLAFPAIGRVRLR